MEANLELLLSTERIDKILREQLMSRARHTLLQIQPPPDASAQECETAVLISGILQNLHLSNPTRSPTAPRIQYGVPGLSNDDNRSCYLNAGLQLVLRTPCLLNAIKKIYLGPKMKEDERKALEGIKSVADFYGSERTDLEMLDRAADNFHLSSIQAFGFTMGQEEDVAEFLMQLFTLLDRVDSTLLNCCRHTSLIVCNGCLKPDPKKKKECSTIAMANVQAGWSIGEMLKISTDLSSCCDGKGTEKIVESCPKYIFIQLNRIMDNFEKSLAAIKLETQVHVKCLSNPGDALQTRLQPYRLIGAACHSGRKGSSGHYYNLIHQNEGKWLKVSDNFLEPATEQILLRNSRSEVALVLLERQDGDTQSSLTTSPVNLPLEHPPQHQTQEESSKKRFGGDLVEEPSRKKPKLISTPKTPQANSSDHTEDGEEVKKGSLREANRKPNRILYGASKLLEAAAKMFSIHKLATEKTDSKTE